MVLQGRMLDIRRDIVRSEYIEKTVEDTISKIAKISSTKTAIVADTESKVEEVKKL